MTNQEFYPVVCYLCGTTKGVSPVTYYTSKDGGLSKNVAGLIFSCKRCAGMSENYNVQLIPKEVASA